MTREEYGHSAKTIDALHLRGVISTGDRLQALRDLDTEYCAAQMRAAVIAVFGRDAAVSEAR